MFTKASQFVVDNTPDQLMRTEFPACWAWVQAMHDMSGFDDKKEPPTSAAAATKHLLQFAGQVYLPFLSANRTR